MLAPFVHGYRVQVRTAGLGLGLSNGRAIAVAHHGRIDLTAQPEGGLDIAVDLPGDSPTTPRRAAS